MPAQAATSSAGQPLAGDLTHAAGGQPVVFLPLRGSAQPLGRVGMGDAVAILDLDHFKAVNDRYGHPAGDRVLSTLATFLERFVREGDSVARYGGEEFVLILRGVDERAAPSSASPRTGGRRGPSPPSQPAWPCTAPAAPPQPP